MLRLRNPTCQGRPMFVAILGDRKGAVPAAWTSETVLALAAEANFDASGGAGPGASTLCRGGGGPGGQGPREAGCAETGLSLLGDRRIEVAAGDGPEIQVRSGACSAT